MFYLRTRKVIHSILKQLSIGALGLFYICQVIAQPAISPTAQNQPIKQTQQMPVGPTAAASNDNTSQFIAYLKQEKAALNNAVQQI